MDRVVTDQLRQSTFTKSSPRILSYFTPSDWYPGNFHWDLVFAYEIELKGPVERLPWWKELRFASRAELKAADFGVNKDIMKDMKLV